MNWTKITGDSKAVRVNEKVEFTNIDNPNYYKYHGIVYDNFSRVEDVKLFGIRNQGSSTLHDGALTLTKNLDVPRIGPPLDADDTPRRDRLVVEYNTSTNPVEDGLVQDTSGRGNDGFMVGSSYDSTDKSLSLTNSPTGTASAATSYITRQSLGNKEEGNFHHSVSLWFKMSTPVSSVYRNIFEIGPNPRVNGKDISLYVTNASATPFGFASGGNTLLSTGSAGEEASGQVYHIVIVYDGSKKYMYINGVLNNSAAYTSFNGVQNMTMQIGRNNHANANEGVDGSISNFKMYVGHALTASEVKTLYDMGRMGGVANPKTLQIASSLDVRGDIYGGCPVFFEVYCSANTSGSTYLNFNRTTVAKGGGWGSAPYTAFYAPIAGYYKFDISMMGTYLNGRGTRIEWRLNGNKYPDPEGLGGAAQMYDYQSAGVSVHLRVSGNTIAYLNVGDWMGIYNSSNIINATYGKFTGFYLSN
jgi:hypothetical protein